jgi:pimeloyl-ACP methyl ester carboxylesterase
VFLHGLHGSAYEGNVMFRRLFEKAGYNFWTRELPGHGDRRRDLNVPESFEQIAAQQLDELIDRMEHDRVEQVVGVAHSLGGGIMLQMAVQAEARGRQVFSHLVLYEPVRTGEDIPIQGREAFLKVLYPAHAAARKRRLLDEDASELAVEVIHQIIKRVGRVAGDKTRVVQVQNEDTKKFSNAAVSRDAWMRYIRAYLRYDGARALRNFPEDLPVLIIQGELTQDDAVHQGVLLQAMLPNAEVMEFEGVAHQGLFRKSEEFIQTVLAFVEAH